MLFATGMPFGEKEGLEETLNEIKNLMPKCAGIRRNGAAALDLAYVAAGRLDGYWERGLNAWDIAAGILIVKESGGLIEGFKETDRPINTGELICSNSFVFTTFSKIIRNN